MAQGFLRIPPFPGHRAEPLAKSGPSAIDDGQALRLVRQLQASRVGGNFWGAQPKLPDGRDIVLIPSSHTKALQMRDQAAGTDLFDRCVFVVEPRLGQFDADIPVLTGDFDGWHICEASAQIWADDSHELGLVASLVGRPVRKFGEWGPAEPIGELDLAQMVGQVLSRCSYACPFTGQPISPSQAIELLSDWRRLIDRNRTISNVFGIANWKRPTVDPMLWNGGRLPLHSKSLPGRVAEGSVMAAWKSRTAKSVLDQISEIGVAIAEIEDGMIRGRGLGANCVPPLSIIVDFSGIYFDPTRPSDLEHILQTAELDEALIDRAARLRRSVVDSGISKYDGGFCEPPMSGGERRVLVLGQVEDDRSILSGAPGQTNLGLLIRARELEPNAWLIYRPHPDVEAGHRRGHVPDSRILEVANEVDKGSSVTSLIESVEGVHCITSLGGFEALLRGKHVTTHGVPFYAGWGLTTDLGPIPSRRNRRLTIDELIAATLILYPTYFDPVTRLPCPPELLVDRIAQKEDRFAAPLAWLRSSQGKLKVALRRIWEAAA